MTLKHASFYWQISVSAACKECCPDKESQNSALSPCPVFQQHVHEVSSNRFDFLVKISVVKSVGEWYTTGIVSLHQKKNIIQHLKIQCIKFHISTTHFISISPKQCILSPWLPLETHSWRGSWSQGMAEINTTEKYYITFPKEWTKILGQSQWWGHVWERERRNV